MAKSKRVRKREVLIYAVIFAAVLLLVFGAAELIEHLGKRRPANEDEEEKAPPTAASASAPGEDELYLPDDGVPEGLIDEPDPLKVDGKYDVNIKNVLLLGIDKQELSESEWYRTGGQCDVIMILSMDTKAKEYFILTINRDLSVPVLNYAANGGSYGVVDEQIALSYAYGDGGRESGKNVYRSLKSLLGEDISFLGYIASPIPIVSKLADAVGGVEVTIEDDFEGVDDTLVKGETVNLTGQHAENFVRARMYMKDDTRNSTRMGRQITFLKAFIDKAKSTMSAQEVISLYDDVLDITMTDMGKSDITKWIATAYDYTFKGVYRIDGTEGERKHDARCTYPDYDEIARLVKELYYK